MKKRWIAALLAFCLMLSFTACADSGSENAGNQNFTETAAEITFVATVLEIYDGSVIVQPVEGSSELRSADKITFGTKDLADIGAQVGDQVRIFYGGQIMESYPAQIHAAKWELVQKEEPTGTETSDIAIVEERTAYSGETWVEKTEETKVNEAFFSDIIITEIYTDCFFAYPVIPMPYQIKLNGELGEDWCVGDQVICTYENIYSDGNHVEADMLTIEGSDFELDPMVAYKPVIYLYPEEETEVSVKLELDGKLTCTYPAYGNGWQVTAAPDGTLTDAKGQMYNYLYWEGETNADWDMTRGFCVKGADTAAFLEQALEKLGLTRREANEFIVYWLPLMEQNPYNIIAFQGETYTNAAALHMDPAPDTLIRIFMTWQASENYVNLQPQELTAPERTGFTVIEWGGTEIK